MNFRSLNRIVLGTAFLVGASGLAYAAPELPGTTNAADQKSEQPVSDTWITTKVKADLAATDGVKSTDISVNTTNGIVTLIGVLDSDTALEKAIATAQGIKGVKKVDSSGLKVR
ncbi:BON domain-containing protein [Dokdonella sp. MW10]|uniref:BON domain-containing protein n=1 Tax=Dokdonella sp. MW10 TaxID=2992926 RepID=UPI003F81CF33